VVPAAPHKISVALYVNSGSLYCWCWRWHGIVWLGNYSAGAGIVRQCWTFILVVLAWAWTVGVAVYVNAGRLF